MSIAVPLLLTGLAASCTLDRAGTGEFAEAAGAGGFAGSVAGSGGTEVQPDASLGGTGGTGGSGGSSIGGSAGSTSGGAGGAPDAALDTSIDAEPDVEASIPPDVADEPEAPVPTLCPNSRDIRITAGGSPVSTDYSVFVDFDHAALVNAGRSQPSGDDVRIVRMSGQAEVDLVRVADPSTAWNGGAVRVWFRVREPIAAHALDNRYRLCWGADAESPPLDDPSSVFLVWDGFDGGMQDAAWSLSLIGDATGTATETNGVLRISGRSGDFWDASDNLFFYGRPASGDFAAEARVEAFGGALDDWAKVGGVMIRQSLERQSRNRTSSPVNGAVAFTNSYRLQDDTETFEETVGDYNPIPAYVSLFRLGSASAAHYSVDGLAWTALGPGITFTQPLTDPIALGIPLATCESSGDGWVEVDWFRVRRLVSSEPVVELLQ